LEGLLWNIESPFSNLLYPPFGIDPSFSSDPFLLLCSPLRL
jgi:hypothetical protein